LPPGKYEFELQAANYFNMWDPEVRSFEVVITPPFWQQMWFRMVMVLCILGLVIWLHWYNTNRLRRINIRLDEQVKERTEKLSQINEELIEADSIKDRFFSIVAHDLRGPIFGISSYTSGILEQVEDLSREDAAEALSTIYDTATGLQHLLENLLEWGELQRNRSPMILVPVQVSEVLQSNLHSFSGLISAKEITVAVECDENLQVYAVSHVLNGIIHNLLHNAIKFSFRGGEITLRAALYSVEGFACIEVIDNGIGMTREQIDSVLNLETHKKKSIGTEGEKGSGLGLLLCKDQIQQLGGHLELQSEKDHGTRARVILPVSRPE
ncbi:MAG: sensor histidine kinase, partial [Spirochaeta sp.]